MVCQTCRLNAPPCSCIKRIERGGYGALLLLPLSDESPPWMVLNSSSFLSGGGLASWDPRTGGSRASYYGQSHDPWVDRMVGMSTEASDRRCGGRSFVLQEEPRMETQCKGFLIVLCYLLFYHKLFVERGELNVVYCCSLSRASAVAVDIRRGVQVCS